MASKKYRDWSNVFPVDFGANKRSLPSRPRGMVRSGFNSGDSGRLTADWSSEPLPAAYIIHRYQRTLVARSREQSRNNDYVKAFLRLNRINIVGSHGFVLQCLARRRGGNAWTAAREGVEDAFAEWSRRQHCDITGKQTLRQLLGLFVQTAAQDGEVFIRKVTGAQAGKFNFALQLIDSQRCPVQYDEVKLRNGNYVRHGIEFTPYGKPVAYYFHDAASEQQNNLAYSYASQNLTRVPADEIIHAFVPELADQRRGLPWLSTGLFRAKQAGAMEDAAVMNARAGAAKMPFIQFAEGTGPEYDEDDGLELDLEPLTSIVLPSGATVHDFNPQYPNNEFTPFVKHTLRSMAAGGGVSYTSLAQDLESVNFSSIRTGKIDERDAYKERQEWFIDHVMTPIFETWLFHALLSNNVHAGNSTLTLADQDQLLEHRFQARRWDWVDPRADSVAAQNEKNNFITSPGKLIRERGGDPEQIWAEAGQDIKAMLAAGIPEDFIKISFGLAATPAPKDTKNDDEQPASDA